MAVSNIRELLKRANKAKNEKIDSVKKAAEDKYNQAKKTAQTFKANVDNARVTAKCLAATGILNQTKTALQKANAAWDEGCPDDAKAKRVAIANEQTTEYIKNIQKIKSDVVANFNRTKKLLMRFTELSNPAKAYINKLDTEIRDAQTSTTKYTHSGKAKRRQFLDEEPQSGVFGLPGVRTYDDKVLLAFWITYGVFTIVITLTAISMLDPKMTMRNTIITVIGASIAAFLIAYMLIKNYG